MPPLLHPPADVLRKLLVGLGHGTEPTTGGSWPVFSAGGSDAPDNILMVTTTEGLTFGRVMVGGERQEHRGFQIMVRGKTEAVAGPKAEAIAASLDEDVYDEQVDLTGASYIVHSITRTGQVLALGKERPDSARTLYSINGLMTIRRL